MGLSLRQADEPDAEIPAELTPVGPESGAQGAAVSAPSTPSLEEIPAHSESVAPSLEASGTATSKRNDGKSERRERANDNPLLSGLPAGETTAMAEAFRAAARQRTKEETENTTEEQSS